MNVYATARRLLVNGLNAGRLQIEFSTTAAASKIDIEKLSYSELHQVVARTEGKSPQKPFKYQKLLAKATSPSELAQAYQSLQQDRKQRDRVAIHKPYPTHLTQQFFKSLQTAGATDVLFEATERANELGLRLSARSVDNVLRQFAQNGDLVNMEKFYLYSQLYLNTSSPKTLFTVIKSFSEAKQLDKVIEYGEEALKAGIHLSPAAQTLIQNAKGLHNETS